MTQTPDWKEIAKEFSWGTSLWTGDLELVQRMAREIVRLRALCESMNMTKEKFNALRTENEKLRTDFKSACELVAILKNQLETVTKERDELHRLNPFPSDFLKLEKEISASRALNAKYRGALERITCNAIPDGVLTYKSHNTTCVRCLALASDPTDESDLAVIRRAMDLMQEIEDLKFGYYGDGRELAEEALAALKERFGADESRQG